MYDRTLTALRPNDCCKALLRRLVGCIVVCACVFGERGVYKASASAGMYVCFLQMICDDFKFWAPDLCTKRYSKGTLYTLAKQQCETCAVL